MKLHLIKVVFGAAVGRDFMSNFGVLFVGIRKFMIRSLIDLYLRSFVVSLKR